MYLHICRKLHEDDSYDTEKKKERYRAKLLTGELIIFGSAEIVGKDWVYLNSNDYLMDGIEVRLSSIVWVQDTHF